MPRKQRLLLPELPQLIAFKGNNNEPVFRDSEDREQFVGCLRQAVAELEVRLYAFALLDNRILLLMSVADLETLTRFVQHLGRRYVQYFNRRHDRSGSLWEGRFRSCGLEPAGYLLLCQKYVDGIADADAGAGVSSRAAHLGEARLDFLAEHPAYLALADDAAGRIARYRHFLAIAPGEAFLARIESCLQQNAVLGSQDFCLALEKRLGRPVQPRANGRPRKHYPDRLNYWLWFEQEAHATLHCHAYREIRLSLVDEGNREWAERLRSEGTIGLLQAYADNAAMPLPGRWWYRGPMFRAGHNRVEQFHQVGAEALGYDGFEIELEQLLLQHDLLQRLKLDSRVELQLNTLGTVAERDAYREALRHYFSPLMAELPPPQAAAAQWMPESLLSPESGIPPAWRAAAPRQLDYLSDASRTRFETLCRGLDAAGVPFLYRQALFPTRVFYQHTYYEWRASAPEIGEAIGRGGRYDEIAGEVIGRPTPACGFAFMVEPLIRLAETLRSVDRPPGETLDVCVLAADPEAAAGALFASRALRSAFPFLAVTGDFGRGRLDAREKRAIRDGARLTLCVQAGNAPLTLHDVADGTQATCPADELVPQIRRWLL